MVSSSSTKRAARLAQKGKGKKVRFQGGTLFPLVVLGVIVAGVALIAYARFSRPGADAAPPTANDHWHLAYGFELCGTEGDQRLSGALEETDANGQLINTDFFRTGVHSHDDGVIHWHPYSTAATGHNATLGVFLDNYGVRLTDDELDFPDTQLGGADYVEGETMCGDEDGQLVAAVWNNFTDTGDPTIYTAGFDNIRIDQDAMVVVIAYVPESADPRDIQMPPWAAQLPTLGAADGGGNVNDPLGGLTTTTVAGATGTAPAGTETGGTAGSTPTSSASSAATATTTAGTDGAETTTATPTTTGG